MLGNPKSIKFVVNDNNKVVLVFGNTSIDNKLKYVKSYNNI